MSDENPRPNPAISAFRYIVWAMPLALFLAAWFARVQFPAIRKLDDFLLLAGPLALAGLALFDALLYCNEYRIPSDHQKARIATGVVMYIAFQSAFLGCLFLIWRFLASWSPGI